ncbi:MAG TPA: hypothetical protein VIV40_03120 [Kofleriaceae bacterium]
MTWIKNLHRALTSPANLLAGAGALALSALTWNPLPLILFGLGEPVWLYTRATRTPAETRIGIKTLEHQLGALMLHSPCGHWASTGKLPNYAAIYAQLQATRDQTTRIVSDRRDAASTLAQDIAARMDDMLHAYLVMVRERLLFHCALANVFPQLPEPPAPPRLVERLARALVIQAPKQTPPWRDDTPFVSLTAATNELQRKIAGFQAQIAQQPAHEEVYRPIIESLTKHLRELEVRGKYDRQRAAQLEVFPDQFAIIQQKLGTPQPDYDDVVTDMKLLLEQTDDTVSLAEELRAN